MTHTEESLLALAEDMAGVFEACGWEPSSTDMEWKEEKRDALRLAIREVLAELADVKMHDQATGIQWRAQYERAEKAEAECERLRDALAELSVAELLDEDHPRLIAAREKALAAMKGKP